jgi:hypothetical protein
MTHEELARHVAPQIALLYTTEQMAELACRLMDWRALTDWAAQLQADPHAAPPAGAFGVAKRG